MNQLRSLGIIMDGNRRWAREQGLPAVAGHRQGFIKLKEVLNWAKQTGVRTVFLYAFSTENWRRSRVEVAALMRLFRRFLKTEVAELLKRDTRLVFIGQFARLSRGLKKLMEEATTATENCKSCALAVAVSYGGRLEIVEAAKLFARKYSDKFEIAGEAEFDQCLSTAGLPDPDLIIRTGGEERLSNFLPWQSVYSEFHFTKTYWPAFSRAEFDAILADYHERQRRFGK